MKRTLIAGLLLMLISLSSFAADDQIFSVILKGNTKDLGKYLKQNPQAINAVDAKERSPLMLAVRLKKNKMAKLLLKHGADPVAPRGQWGNFALQEAIWAQNEEMVKWFYLKGVDINYVKTRTSRDGTERFYPVFHDIVRVCSPDLIKFMIERGVDIGTKNWRGENCLTVFSFHDFHYSGNKEYVLLEKLKILVKAGVNLNAQNKDEETLLLRFVSSSSQNRKAAISVRLNEVVKFLIKNGADLDLQDYQGWTPLHSAVWFHNTEILKILLDAGADPTIEHKDGEKPIDFAKRLKRKEMVKVLKKAEKSRK